MIAGYRQILPPASLRSSTPLVNEGGKGSALNYNLCYCILCSTVMPGAVLASLVVW